jgi:hypothetical protein
MGSVTLLSRDLDIEFWMIRDLGDLNSSSNHWAAGELADGVHGAVPLTHGVKAEVKQEVRRGGGLEVV